MGSYYRGSDGDKFGSRTIKFCVGVFLLSLLACCSLLCVLIGATHCHSVFDGACEDINKLIPIGFWTILYCCASFLVTHLVQECAKSFGGFKFDQLWPPLKGLDGCFRTCNVNPFANRLLILLLTALAFCHVTVNTIPVIPLSYGSRHMMLSAANTFFLSIFLSSTIISTIYNAYKLNALYKEQLTSSKSRKNRPFSAGHIQVSLPNAPTPSQPEYFHGRTSSTEQKPNQIYCSQASGQTSGVGSSSTVLSSREDILYSGK
jgi:hypothetical protein